MGGWIEGLQGGFAAASSTTTAASSVQPGPSPESLESAARRLAAIAGDVDAVRLEMGSLAVTDWKSPAATAFRDALAEQLANAARAVLDIQDAAAAVRLYGRSVAAANAAVVQSGAHHLAPGFGSGMGAAFDGGTGPCSFWPPP
ncbi:hypothetical protein AL755_21300 [Arthrobacter sp. ERGS1:01]|uniref:WXG100 family type VII secretion target n=1 Tax=Arthrobacter sp. ERGS1:01 TaxID=1704044 RepID=UPI0006B5F833|nr:hypothetical protein [Arthrobacter sp. ERGS1:01]ALE07426.1 hypothetical protein AL755_21300 [Arthrobacter sp. ERGS1:01]